MKAGCSYLRSMTESAGGFTLPVLRAAPVPVWPVPRLGAEFFKESVLPTDGSPHRTRVSDTLEIQTALQNRVDPMPNPVVESLSLSPPASTATERTALTPSAARMHREGQEELPSMPTVPSQIGRPQQEMVHEPSRIEPQASANRKSIPSVSVAHPVMPSSAATASVSLNVSASVATPQDDKTSLGQKRASYFSSSPENGGERSFRERPLRSDAATRSQFQLEPAPVAERASARPAAKTTAQFADSRGDGAAQSRNSVHIGKIDINIAPPLAPAAPRQTMRSVPANSSAALARGFLSSFGLRQG